VAPNNKRHGRRSLIRPSVETELPRKREMTRVETPGRKIGPSYPGGLSGHKSGDLVALTGPLHHQRSCFLTEALVTVAVTKSFNLGDGGILKGEGNGRSY
jgi:hypothetical protein